MPIELSIRIKTEELYFRKKEQFIEAKKNSQLAFADKQVTQTILQLYFSNFSNSNILTATFLLQQHKVEQASPQIDIASKSKLMHQQKRRSLEQQAKQSQSIKVHQTLYSDYIDEQVKQNQITSFELISQHHAHNRYPSISSQSNSLKEMSSNDQNKRTSTNNTMQKSVLQSNEVKLYKERVQTLENRLKEKNVQLKFKEDQINRLMAVNQELQEFKLKMLLGSRVIGNGQRCCPQKNAHKEHKQIQTDFLSRHQEKYHKNEQENTKVSPLSEEFIIQMRFQLEKHKKKYIIIEQTLKKRTTQFQSHIQILHKKLKQQKQQLQKIKQESFYLQDENIDLKQKLQEAIGEIEELQIEREQRSNQTSLNLRGLQVERRFSFGEDQKGQRPTSNPYLKQSRPIFLSIFNELSYSFIPKNFKQTGRFKHQAQKKRNSLFIRLYSRMYEIKILESSSNCLAKASNQIGINTIKKQLFLTASVNMKVNVPPLSPLLNNTLSQTKTTKKSLLMKICSRQVSYQTSLFVCPSQNYLSDKPKTQLAPHKKIESHIDDKTFDYKIKPREQRANSMRNDQTQIRQFGPSVSIAKLPLNQNRFSVGSRLNDRLNVQKQQEQTCVIPSDKTGDILQRINSQLKRSHLASPFFENKQTQEHTNQRSKTFVRSFSYQNLIKPDFGHQEPIEYQKSSKIRVDSNQNMVSRPNEYKDWIVDDIHQETNKILQKYIPSSIIQPRTNLTLPKSTSRQSLYEQQFHPSPISLTQTQRTLQRNMSLSALDNPKIRQSFLQKNNNSTLRLNSTQNHQRSLMLTINRNRSTPKVQQILTKDSRVFSNHAKDGIIGTVPLLNSTTPVRSNANKICASLSIKDLIAQKCKKLSIN